MMKCINDAQRNRIDHVNKTLRLSQIFNWYADDFGGADKIASYVNQYTEEDVSGYTVEFLEFDWSLNITPPETGDWIRVNVDLAVLLDAADRGERLGFVSKNQVFSVLSRDGDWIEIVRPFGAGNAWIASWLTKNYE